MRLLYNCYSVSFVVSMFFTFNIRKPTKYKKNTCIIRKTFVVLDDRGAQLNISSGNA